MADAPADIKRRPLPSAPPTVEIFSRQRLRRQRRLSPGFTWRSSFQFPVQNIFTSDVVRCIFRSAKRFWRATNVGEPLIKSGDECA